ncbi:MAG: SdrD B-like domain-containing protein [Schumannella sp.]
MTAPAIAPALPVPAASAAGSPDIQLSRSVAAQSLYGRDVAVTLTATSPDSTPDVDAYNLTFSDVLPVGASVTSSTFPVSRTIPQIDGTTLVIWENVADLLDDTSVSISYTFDYPVLGDTDPYDVGTDFAGTAHAYVSTDPFLIPNPMDTPVDGSVWEDYTGWADAASSTELVPFIVGKSEPSREGELLRGIHDNKTVYTITVTNNTVAPTTGPVVTDYLPAALEFLGCTATDNSSAAEYPGAPALDASFPSVTSCDPLYTAETVQLDPDGAGPMPSAVYTRVVWDQLADLAAGAVITLRYAAGIPLHANVLDPLVTEAVANLDNNTGPEADDEQPIVNYVTVSADYQGGAPAPSTFVVDATATVTAEDVRIWKTAGDGEINQGQATTWTLDIATSEYTQSTEPIVVTDTIPDGLDWAGSSVPLSAGPTANSDGTLTVEWTLPALGTQDTTQLTFQTTTRADYRATGEPVSANDSWTNNVALATGTTLRSGADGTGTRAVADVVDVSEAGQIAEDVDLNKTIGVPVGGDCTVVTAWTDDSAAAIHPGDVVCYRLDVDFPDHLDTQRARIADYLPPGFSIVGDPYYNEPLHDLGDSAALSYTRNPAGTVMTWTKEAVDVGTYFSVILTVQVAATGTMQKTDLAANLLKVRTQNSDGDAFQLRDQAAAEVTAPLLTLDKDLVTPASGTVEAGDPIHYTITVANIGGQDATAAEVRDVLPTGWSCAEVTSTSPAADSCTSGTVVWTGLAVPAGGSVVLDVYAVAPTSAAPGDSYENHAGVRSYQGDTNSGPHTYYPRDNIDPTVTPNTDPADDTELVAVGGGAITKVASSLVESGNNSASQATIGEVVTFTITATIPSGTTLYGSPDVTDTINARYAIVGTPTFTLDTDGSGPGVPSAAAPAVVSGSTVSVPLGPLDGDANDTTYVNPAGSGADVVVLTVQARVLDVATNKRSINTAIPNTATLRWQNSLGTARSASASRSMTVVEPNLSLNKTSDHDGTGIAAAGDIVNYTVTVGNSGTRSSMAHEVRVTDTLPVQVEPLTTGDVPAGDGDTLIGGGVWDASTRVITFPEVATIAVNGSSAFTYRVRVIDPVVVSGPIVNTARAVTSSLTGAATGERDSTSPNGGTGSGYVVTATRTLAAPPFTLSKAATPATRTAGELVTYTLTAGIPAGVFGYDVTILDTLPAGVRYHAPVSVTCQQGAGACSPAVTAQIIGTPTDADGVIGFFLGDVAEATEARTVTITFQGIVLTTAATGTQTNSARIYSNDTDTLGTPTTPPAAGSFTRPGPTATASTTVQRPQLSLTKLVNGVESTRAVPGQVLHYTVAITNNGTSPAYDLTVTDTPDARLAGYTPVSMPGATAVDTDPSDGTLSWTIAGPVAVGATVTLAYDLTVPATLDETDEIVGAELVNTADVPSYFGVPEADRVLDPSRYNEYDDVPADQAQVELDLASLGDRIWFDADGDGVQDAGEPGIPGVRVTVLYAGPNGTFGNGDDESRVLTTNANGYYLAEYLPGGQYRVTVTAGDLPGGLTPSYDLNGIATPHVWTGALAEAGAPRDVDFGYTGTGSIGDLVWYDQDADGAQDAGEPGIAGRDVRVVWFGFDGDEATTADNVTYDVATSASGVYSVTRLPAGSYRVSVSGMPAGYGVTGDPDGTLDGVSLTTLTAGQNRTDQDFGYAGTGSIGDLVWLDRDEDGVYEPAGTPPEQGIAGATVVLDWHGVSGTTSDPVVGSFTTTTDGSGGYLFQNLVPGEYTVRVTGGLPAAATNTFDRDGDLDSSAPVSLTLGGAVLDADFGYSSDSSLGERVWWDRDGDGVQDADEPGFPGVDVTVRYFGPNGIEGDGDDLVFSTVTNATGYWSVGDLPEGTYRTTVDSTDLPAGFSPTFDADGLGAGSLHTSTTALGTGAVLTQNFGYRGAYSLGDLVFLDRDADGVQDAGEPGIAGVTVQLTWGAFTLGAVTDASGLYGFEGLPAGTFTVTMLTASLPSTSLTPVSDLEGAQDDASAIVVLTADRTDADFGVRGDASLGDLVWHDRDADGVLDADEAGIPGVTVTATWAGRDAVSGTSDDVTISTTTDANGAYGFDRLPVGEWTVEVDLSTLPSGFDDATFEEDGVLDASVVVTLAAGDAHETADFGYRGTGSIGDRVWFDLDGDGAQDAGEPGIVGQEVRVVWAGRDGTLGTADDETWTTTTGADGAWGVTGLPDGLFRVTVVDGITTRATQTGDPDATMDDRTDVSLTPVDRTEDAADFGYRGDYAVGDTVWWDESEDGVVDAGELRLPGATVTVTWAGLDDALGTADDIVLTATTDASGEYLVEHLPTGGYRAAVTAGIPAGLDPIADPDGVGASADGVSEFDLPGATVGTQDLTRDFGYAGSGELGDRVWLDLDGNGTDAAGEPGIPGVTVTLTWFGVDGLEGTADDVAWTTTTDAAGAYGFDGLPAGDFRVALAGLPSGVAPTADPDGTATANTALVTLAAGASDLDQDFGYAGTASLGDLVWLDLDDDGLRDPLEPGLPGIVVTARLAGADGVLGTADDIVLTRMTDASGIYLATGLPPGPVEVGYDPAALDPGYVPSFDRDGGDAWSSTLTLQPGDAIDDVDFAIVGDARLHGVVYDDRDADGRRDTGEPGVPGVDITVVWNGPFGPIPIVVTTDALGEWSLDSLPPGTYVSEIVTSTVPAGYRVITERSVTRVLPPGGVEFVIMGITNRPLALTGYDPRTNLFIGLCALLLGIGGLTIARVRRGRQIGADGTQT